VSTWDRDPRQAELPVAYTLGSADGVARLSRLAGRREVSSPRAGALESRLEVRGRLDGDNVIEFDALAAAEREYGSFLSAP
jgi:hypothetical protein